MKKKIVFLVPVIENCGPVNVVFNIISNLDLHCFDIMLISVRDSSHNCYFEYIEKYCSLGVLINGVSADELEKIVENKDVIHSHGFYPDKMVRNLKNKNIIKITTIHNSLFKDYIQEYGYVKGIIGSMLHLNILRSKRFDYIVACSKTVKNHLRKYLFSENFIFINNGVDHLKFHTISYDEKKKRRTNLGLDGKTIFIFSGRLIRRKRVPELMEKFIELFSKDNKKVLIILGDGEEMNICRSKVTEQIKLLGYVDNPIYYYQIADYVVSMSNAEGYPMSIIEAVLCGCYAFLSDIPAHREFIELNASCANFIDNLSSITCDEQYNMSTQSLSAIKMANNYSDIYTQPKRYVD